MEFHEFLSLIAKKRKTIYGIMALFLLVACVIIVSQRFKYSAKSQLLVVQEYNGAVDPYTASKSSEHLSTVLASVVSSNSFFTKVLASSSTIDTSYFGTTPKDQMKQWGRTIKAASINDSGIIAITAYHPNRSEAEKIANAVNYVLMTQHGAYDGANNAVKVRLIDQPVTSSFPVKPNIPLIAGLAVMLGFASSMAYIYLLPEGQRDSRSLAFEDIMAAHAPQLHHPHRQQRPAHRGIEVRGQLPEEAVATLGGSPEISANLSAYGLHSQVENIPHGHQARSLESVIEPEGIVQQGNMRNILN